MHEKKKNACMLILDIFASFGSWAKKFWENILKICKFFWENFGRAPSTPKPANQKMVIFGYFQKWPKRGVDLHFWGWSPQGCSHHPSFFLQSQVFHFRPSLKFFFGARTFRTPTSKWKFSILTKILNFDPQKIWVVGSERTQIFFWKTFHRVLWTTTVSISY